VSQIASCHTNLTTNDLFVSVPNATMDVVEGITGDGTGDGVDAIDGDVGSRPIPVRTISRATAESENGFVVTLYRDGDGALMTYEELYEEVDAEGSALPPEQWIDGAWNAHEYIVEACLVGIYDRLDAVATVVVRDTGETVVEYTGDGDEFVAERLVGE
jgi:hypothetical protein